jgi:hypothetical protein
MMGMEIRIDAVVDSMLVKCIQSSGTKATPATVVPSPLVRDQPFHALVTTANYAVTWCDSVYCSEDSESD